MKSKFFLLIFILTFSCQCRNEIRFKGEVFIVENKPDTDILHGQSIKLSEIYTGKISVYDSLIVFSSKKYDDYFSSVFNLNNGKRINLYINTVGDENEEIYCYDARYLYK
jgi:hypothetical protein